MLPALGDVVERGLSLLGLAVGLGYMIWVTGAWRRERRPRSLAGLGIMVAGAAGLVIASVQGAVVWALSSGLGALVGMTVLLLPAHAWPWSPTDPTVDLKRRLDALASGPPDREALLAFRREVLEARLPDDDTDPLVTRIERLLKAPAHAPPVDG